MYRPRGAAILGSDESHVQKLLAAMSVSHVQQLLAVSCERVKLPDPLQVRMHDMLEMFTASMRKAIDASLGYSLVSESLSKSTFKTARS